MTTIAATGLTPAQLAPIIREVLKDKSYRASELGEWVGRYMRWVRNERGFQPTTIRDYEAVLARMAITLGDKKPTDVTINDLREVIDLWGLREPKTRAKVTSVVRSFWSWAEEEGHVEVSPAARLRRPKVPKKVAPLLPERVDLVLIDAAPSPRDRLALACLLWLGIRRSELRGIRIRDFDVDRQELRVFGKGAKGRVLPLRGRILDELGFYLSADLPHVGRPPEPDDFLLYPTRRLYAGRGREGEQKRVTRGYPKSEPSVQYVHRWWYRMLEQAHLVGKGVRSGLNMHRARHTFARELRREAGIEAASQALGHSDLSTTLGIYGHSDGTDLERAMEQYAKRRES